jgi:undecaprenyl-diphosphatase
MSQRYHQLLLLTLLFVLLEALLIVFLDPMISNLLWSLDKYHPEIVDIFQSFTDLGKSQWYLWPAAAGVLFCALAIRRKSLARQTREKLRRAGEFLLYLFVCVAASGILTDILKPIIGRSRPVEWQQDGFYEFHPLTFAARWNSMPSGHAATAFTLGFVLAEYFPRAHIPIFVLAVILALSRVIVNAHFLSDVLAGGLVAYLTVAGAGRLKKHNGICHINHSIFPIDGARRLR